MSIRRQRDIWREALPAAALTIGVGLLGSGCSREPAALGNNFSAAAATTSGSYRLPLDSVPSADGGTFYFTAMGTDAMGNTMPGVFSVPAGGGEATLLHLGAPLASPLGIAISSDDQMLFIADAAAGYDPNDRSEMPGESIGQILKLSVQGGRPTPIAAGNGFRPKGITLIKQADQDMIYFTGHNSADGKPGVFSLPSDGASVKVLATGGPLTDPAGVDVARDGTVYVTNTTNPLDATANVYSVPGGGGAPTSVLSRLKVGYPAGLALSMDSKTLLISGQDPVLNTTIVYRANLDTREVGTINQGIENHTDAGGLHRAAGSDLFSWCGVTAGTAGQGIVYRISF